MVKRKSVKGIEGPSKRKKEEEEQITSLADLSSQEEDAEEISEDNDISSDEDDEEDDEEQANGKGKKVNIKTLSAEDVQIARETSELFKSNVFKLQIDELMSEIKLQDKHTRQIEKILFQINTCITNMPEFSQQYTLAEAEAMFKRESLEKKIVIPFPDPKPTKDIQYKFEFARPDKVNVIGGYSLKTAVYQPEGTGIDMLVVMPSHLFQEKDYLNYRYFHKRAFYVAVLAKELKNKLKELPVKVQYTNINDDFLRPILRLEPIDERLAAKFKINLLVGAHTDVFAFRKLSPDRNCIRLQEQEQELPPTVNYNSCLISDCTYEPYLEFLHRTSKQCETFSEACKLGRLWLRQRGFDSSHRNGGFGHFEWSMLMACLLQGGGGKGSKVLMNGYSSYQLFKATLKFLSSQDLGERTLVFSTKSNQTTVGSALPGDRVAALFDSDFKLNVLWKMSGWSYNLLRHEASITCDLLNDVVKDRFEVIFLKNLTQPRLRFDVTFRVSFSQDNFQAVDKIQYISYERYFIEKLYRIIFRGCGDRVRQIGMVYSPLPSTWNISKRRAESRDQYEVIVGLILNSDECEKLVTHGPSAENEAEADMFRKFWGSKSELRRFQDGSIKESVLWKASPTKAIVQTIIEYLTKLHLPTTVSLNFNFQRSLNSLIPNVDDESSITNLSLFNAKYSSFQQCAYMLQELNELPLRVKSVMPTSSSLRFASIYQPMSFELTKCDDVVANGILEFESSNKWPDDLEAVERTKTAFLLKISELVNAKQSNQYNCIVGVEDHHKVAGSTVQVGFLDIQTPQGYMFRLRVATDRDELLYKRLVQDKPPAVISSVVQPYIQTYVGSRSHNRIIHTLSLRFPFYSPTLRLVKRWFEGHMLSNHFKPQAIELLVLKPFLDSAPYNPPSSAVAGFFRVIEFLAQWDWRSEPLILDVEKAADRTRDDEGYIETTKSGEEVLERENVGKFMNATMTPVEGTQMNQKLFQQLLASFSAQRVQDPALTHAPLFIGTKVDSTGVLWTQMLPFNSPVGLLVASRMTSLARAVMGIVRNGENGENMLEANSLFTPALSDFDIVIHTTNPSVRSSKPSYKNLEIQSSFPSHDEAVVKSTNVIDELYKDLSTKFQDSLILFYSSTNQHPYPSKTNVIGGIWYKEVSQPKKFKVHLGYSTMPAGLADDDDAMVEVNKPAIIEEIKRLGGDLVSSVSCK